MPTSQSSNLERLNRYAEAHGLGIVATSGDQREPENVVAITASNRNPALIRRTSLDSVDTAAFYLINTLELLGVEVPR